MHFYHSKVEYVVYIRVLGTGPHIEKTCRGVRRGVKKEVQRVNQYTHGTQHNNNLDLPVNVRISNRVAGIQHSSSIQRISELIHVTVDKSK